MDNAKVKIFLDKKLDECLIKIKKYKRTKRGIKIINIGLTLIIIISPCILSVVAPMATSLIPIFILNAITISSGVASSISHKFGLKNKELKLKNMLDKLEKIKNKLDYVTSCNGDLTKDECDNILKEFINL